MDLLISINTKYKIVLNVRKNIKIGLGQKMKWGRTNMKCKKCGTKLKRSFYGYGIRCWNNLSKTRRLIAKWFG